MVSASLSAFLKIFLLLNFLLLLCISGSFEGALSVFSWRTQVVLPLFIKPTISLILVRKVNSHTKQVSMLPRWLAWGNLTHWAIKNTHHRSAGLLITCVSPCQWLCLLSRLYLLLHQFPLWIDLSILFYVLDLGNSLLFWFFYSKWLIRKPSLNTCIFHLRENVVLHLNIMAPLDMWKSRHTTPNRQIHKWPRLVWVQGFSSSERAPRRILKLGLRPKQKPSHRLWLGNQDARRHCYGRMESTTVRPHGRSAVSTRALFWPNEPKCHPCSRNWVKVDLGTWSSPLATPGGSWRNSSGKWEGGADLQHSSIKTWNCLCSYYQGN